MRIVLIVININIFFLHTRKSKSCLQLIRFFSLHLNVLRGIFKREIFRDILVYYKNINLVFFHLVLLLITSLKNRYTAC